MVNYSRQPFKVARNLVGGLSSESRGIKRDFQTMSDPVTQLQDYAADLDHLGCSSELDIAHTLKDITL